MTKGIVFPKRSEELTPELLTRVLRERQPEATVVHLRVVEEAHCNTGSASTAARAVLDLGYAPGRDSGYAAGRRPGYAAGRRPGYAAGCGHPG